MKKLVTKFIYILSLLLVFNSCDDPKADPPNNNNDPCEERFPLTTGIIEPKTVKGGDFPEFKPSYDKLDEISKPFYVPNGPKRGNMDPKNIASEIKKGGPSEAVSFQEYDELNDITNAHSTVPEPSVAENGDVVMTVGNFWVSLSLDGGQNFTSVNPTTIFPNDYGGFCCDQVLQYVPEYDMFVWLLQYTVDASGQNAIRIAIQKTQEVISSNGTSWTYWDFTNDALASSGALDRNDLSFGNQFLYWSTSIGGGSNRYAIRIPLSELSNKTTVNYQFTSSTTALFSHVTQNGSNSVYWAGHENNSTIKVYSMRDADNFYSWRSVNINSWPNNTISSIATDGNDWLADSASKTYIRAAIVKGENILFAWNASSNSNFPQAHVQIVEINSSSFNLVNQMQIWNPDFAFAYPYFETNNKGQIGMITAFGGGSFNASCGVGVWGDFVIYYPRLSQVSKTNYGHYITTRRSGSDGSEWVASGYTYEGDGSVLPFYIRYNH